MPFGAIFSASLTRIAPLPAESWPHQLHRQHWRAGLSAGRGSTLDLTGSFTVGFGISYSRPAARPLSSPFYRSTVARPSRRAAWAVGSLRLTGALHSPTLTVTEPCSGTQQTADGEEAMGETIKAAVFKKALLEVEQIHDRRRPRSGGDEGPYCGISGPIYIATPTAMEGVMWDTSFPA